MAVTAVTGCTLNSQLIENNKCTPTEMNIIERNNEWLL